MLPSFELFGGTLYSYPLFVGMAWALAYVLYKKLSIFSSSLMRDVYFGGLFLSTWAGAKLLFYIISGEPSHTESFILGGGFVFYGGLISGVVFTLTYFSIAEVNFKELHKLIPILAASHGVGRLGCFLSGCCYGDFLTSELRHPTQLYESFFLIALAIHLQLRLSGGKSTIFQYLLSYSIFRFFLEFLRADSTRGIYMYGLSTSQIVSIGILVIVFFYSLVVQEMIGDHK